MFPPTPTSRLVLSEHKSENLITEYLILSPLFCHLFNLPNWNMHRHTYHYFPSSARSSLHLYSTRQISGQENTSLRPPQLPEELLLPEPWTWVSRYLGHLGISTGSCNNRRRICLVTEAGGYISNILVLNKKFCTASVIVLFKCR